MSQEKKEPNPDPSWNDYLHKVAAAMGIPVQDCKCGQCRLFANGRFPPDPSTLKN